MSKKNNRQKQEIRDTLICFPWKVLGGEVEQRG